MAGHAGPLRKGRVMLQDSWVLIGLFLALLYVLPSLIAHGRGHRQRVAISVLNALAGWTFVGWLGALVWSLTNPLTITGREREVQDVVPVTGAGAMPSYLETIRRRRESM